MKDAKQAREPVLRRILTLVGRDELRHTQFAYDLLAAAHSARYPAEAYDGPSRRRMPSGTSAWRSCREVPIAEKNEFAAIVTMSQKIKRLTGQAAAHDRVGGESCTTGVTSHGG